ncbi:hypothetical protein BT69DRAFT_33558 [Atractiella rhizophila]|nr:hypothetical protein BT69DRAFT_33558 [Atractiella rhizophila]
MLICTAYKRSRFFIFTTLEPESETSHGHHGDRDVLNEKPTREELNLALSVASANAVQLAKEATIHTTVGDVKLRLFPNEAPKAVENFCGLVRKGYYDGIIFHRVIPKFMIQTGDPLGDGTGGESLWGRNFEDEFHPKLKHDRPYTLSMANAGANTNGSQFFITTVPTPWLDNKHTIFGRAVAGLDVIHSIENVRVDKTDKPLDDIKIVGIDLGN